MHMIPEKWAPVFRQGSGAFIAASLQGFCGDALPRAGGDQERLRNIFVVMRGLDPRIRLPKGLMAGSSLVKPGHDEGWITANRSSPEHRRFALHAPVGAGRGCV